MCLISIFIGVHDYDVMRWMLGHEATRATTEATSGVLRSRGHDVDDTVWALIRFDGGAIGVAETGWALPAAHPGFEQALEVVGTEGSLAVTSGYGVVRIDPGGTRWPDTGLWPRTGGRVGGALAAELRHFVDCVRTGQEPAVTGEDGLAALRIATAVHEAAATGEPVGVERSP